MDNNMLKFIKIRNSYGIRRIGELSINEQALLEYEKFCLDLIKENEKQKEVIDMFINIVDKNKMLLNNPDLLDLYLKIKRCQND